MVVMLLFATLSARGLSLEMTQEILNQGRNYLLGDSIRPDSAVICFQQLTDIYRPELPLKQREICGTAANNLGFVYYQYLRDYKSAYESLLKAREICKGTGRAVTKVNVCINLGNLYSIFFEQVGSSEFKTEAIESYRNAFITAYDNKLWKPMLYSFCNLTELGQELDSTEQQKDILDKYASAEIPPETPLSEYSKLRYNAIRSYIDGDKEKAASFLIESINSVDDDISSFSWRVQAINLTIYLYLDRDMLDSAYFYVNRLLDYAEEVGSIDARANAYKFLREIYIRKGDEANARDAYARMLMVRDSMLNENELGSLSNLKFIHDLAEERNNAASKLAEADRQKKIRDLVIFFIGLLLVVIIPLMIVIVNRHRRLQASYRNLFNQRQQINEQEDTNRILRKESMARNEGEMADADAHPGALQVLAALDKSEEIFDPDFSLERLSELTGIRPRTLSGILNEQLHLTFRDLLNQYRVREACKKLGDPVNYGRYTIEAISQSVGYKSRTSLISAFKKETGLTPSEYQKLALRKNI